MKVSCEPILGILDLVIVIQKKNKNLHLLVSKISQFAYNSKISGQGKQKFGQNMGANRGFMLTKFGGPPKTVLQNSKVLTAQAILPHLITDQLVHKKILVKNQHPINNV